MRHELGRTIRPLPLEIDPAITAAVRASVARQVSVRALGVSQADRDDVSQVAALSALARIMIDAQDMGDACVLAVRDCIQDYYTDRRANLDTSGAEDPIESLSRLPGDSIHSDPAACTLTTSRDIAEESLNELWRTDVHLYDAAVQWVDMSKTRARVSPDAPPLPMRATLGRALRDVMPEIVADVISGWAWMDGSAHPRAHWTDDTRTRADALSGLTVTRGPACVRCDHTTCSVIRTVHVPVHVGRGIDVTGGIASSVITRVPQAGPACADDLCSHRTCHESRDNGYRMLNANECYALGMFHLSAHKLSASDVMADDQAYACTPSGAVRPPSGRRKSGGKGGVGTAMIVRGPRHAWGDKADNR